MHWTRVDKKWAGRKDLQPGQELESGVTFTIENWVVPGEDPLPVRVVTRKRFPLSSYSSAQTMQATSITLHETCGYGNFAGMMGGNDPAHPTKVGAHFMTGRDGNAYLLIPVDRVAWHANMWSMNSIGIEVDNIGGLHEHGGDGQLYTEYGNTGAYCAKSDAGVYLEKTFQGTKYWATWSSDQYDCTARLIKAICHKLQIPRYIQPEPDRYGPLTGFSKAQLAKFRGVMTHYQVNPNNRSDIGPYIDWARLIYSAGLTEGDCFNTPVYSDELTDPGTPPEKLGSSVDDAAPTISSEAVPAGPTGPSGATSPADSFSPASFSSPVLSAGPVETSEGPAIMSAEPMQYETPGKLPKYVFVLSLENRSFDHLFGRSGIRGGDAEERGTPTEVNGVLTPDGSIDPRHFNMYGGKKYSVAEAGKDGKAPQVMPCDPKHEFEHILCQTCGPDALADLMKVYDARPEGLGHDKTLPASYWDSIPRPSQSFPLYKLNNWYRRSVSEPDVSKVPTRPEPDNTGYVHSYVRSYNTNLGTGGSDTPDSADQCDDPGAIMACFDTQQQLPVLYELASQFTICDNFFASLPGPTAPNRFFMMGGSSGGYEASPTSFEMIEWANGSHVPLKAGNIFTHLNDADVEWQVFGDDNFPMAGTMQGVHTSADVHGNTINSLETLLRISGNGWQFPYNFVWIEPDYDVLSSETLVNHLYGGKHAMYSKGNSMHPCGDVAKAEKLVADIYTWISTNKAIWENCVLFITWDEHGAFWDHVPSPKGSPPGKDPIGRTWDFPFDRLGARVPCLVISPLIEPNMIDHRQYDHSSILKTVIDLNNAGAFGAKKKMSAWTDRIRDASSMIDLFSIGPSRQASVTLSPKTVAPDSEPQGEAALTHPDARPSGNVPTFLLAALARHKQLDKNFNAHAQALKLTTNRAAGEYFAKVDAMINARKKKAPDPNLPVA